jgi:hypothetical protein
MIPMRSRAARTMYRAWKRHSHMLPMALLTSLILLLSWIVLLAALRSGLFGWSGSLSADEIKVFPILVVGGLGTAATLFAQLITRDHSKREQHRQRLETIIKSLESLPAQASKPHMAGVLSTMVLLGQQRVAIRVLGPAWDQDRVDDGTATWVIDQVITATHGDDAAIGEASVLLFNRAHRLIDVEQGTYYFPGHFMRRWSTERELPHDAKDNLLQAMGKMLVSRDKTWWCPDGYPPEWPTKVLMECAENDSDSIISSSAAVLFAALHDCFPAPIRAAVFSAKRIDPILGRAAEVAKIRSAATESFSVYAEYFSLADQIRTDWSGLAAVENGRDGTPLRDVQRRLRATLRRRGMRG